MKRTAAVLGFVVSLLLALPITAGAAEPNSLLPLEVEGKGVCYVNAEGVPVLFDDWSYASFFENGVAVVTQKDTGLEALINDRGEYVTPYMDTFILYDEWFPGITRVMIGGDTELCALYLREEQSLCPFDFIQLYPGGTADEPYAAVSKALGTYGYVDRYGNEVIPFVWDYEEPFSDGLAWVQNLESDMRSGYIDTTGQFVILPSDQWQSGFWFSEGLACVVGNDSCGFIDTSGILRIPVQYEDSTYYFSQGRAGVKLGGRWGFIDQDGTLIGTCEYLSVRNFSSDRAPVMTEQKLWGYVNLTGELCIDAKYVTGAAFDENGRAWVTEDGENYDMIDKDGNVLCTYQTHCYEGCELFPSHGIYYSIQDAEFFGVVDSDGNEIYPPVWDRVLFADDQFIYLEKDGVVCYGDYSGNIVLPKD